MEPFEDDSLNDGFISISPVCMYLARTMQLIPKYAKSIPNHAGNCFNNANRDLNRQDGKKCS